MNAHHIGATRSRQQLGILCVIVLSTTLGHGAPDLDDQGPVGLITAVSTASGTRYNSTVEVAYADAVVCSLEFDRNVTDFGLENLTLSPAEAEVSSFVALSSSSFRFLLSAGQNANLTVEVAPGAATAAAGNATATNRVTTAIYSVEYFAYPPSIDISFDGLPGAQSARADNLVYLAFNSSTSYDGIEHFNASQLTLSPGLLAAADFKRVSDSVFSFRLQLPVEVDSDGDGELLCFGEDELSNATGNDTDEGDADAGVDEGAGGEATFRCAACQAPELCHLPEAWPLPGGLPMEMPVTVQVSAVHALGMPSTTLLLMYDTLWPKVTLDVPQHAAGPFAFIVTWSEDLADLRAVLPVISGVAVDPGWSDNMTDLSPRSYRVFVEPLQTGVVTIMINGTRDTVDLAGNANDIRVDPRAATGAFATAVYSAGPPLMGSVSSLYKEPVPGVLSSGIAENPELVVSWSGFVTAVRYTVWVEWGRNLKSEVVSDLSGNTHVFRGFRALLGVEYTVRVRAVNFWNQSTTASQEFLRPYSVLRTAELYVASRLPDLLSPWQQTVRMDVEVFPDTFFSTALSRTFVFRGRDNAARDANPCKARAEEGKCTGMNFHIDVPGARFVLFKRPIQLTFTFGAGNWADASERPQLRYWEEHEEEWRVAAQTCPDGQAGEHWDAAVGVYTVAVCHLTLFGVFQVPAVSVTRPSPPTLAPRGESETGAMFFVGVAAATLAAFALCALTIRTCRSRRGRAAPACAGDQTGPAAPAPLTDRQTAEGDCSSARAGPTRRVHPGEDDDSRQLLSAVPVAGAAGGTTAGSRD